MYECTVCNERFYDYREARRHFIDEHVDLESYISEVDPRE